MAQRAQRNREQDDTNTISRRTILRTGGTLAALAVTGTAPTGAQSDEQLPLEISIYAEEEYITITNTGDETVDLTGYWINFDAEGGNKQTRQLSGEVVIEPGDSITVPTGAREVTVGRVVELKNPYTGEILNNEEPDVVAILDRQRRVVATSDGSGGGRDDGGQTDDDADDGGQTDDDADDGGQTDDGSDTDDAGDTGDDDADGSDDGESDGRADPDEDERNETGGATGDADVSSEGSDDGGQTTAGDDSDDSDDDCPNR